MTSGLPQSQSSAESRPGRVQRRHVRLHCRCEQSERDGQQAAGGVEHVSADAARTLLGVKRSAFASPLVLRGAGARRRRRKVLSYQLCVGSGEEIAGRVTSAFTTNKEEPVLAGLELTLGAPLDAREAASAAACRARRDTPRFCPKRHGLPSRNRVSTRPAPTAARVGKGGASRSLRRHCHTSAGS